MERMLRGGPHITSPRANPGGGGRSRKAHPPRSASVPPTPPPLPPPARPRRPRAQASLCSGPRNDWTAKGHGPAARGAWARVEESRGRGTRPSLSKKSRDRDSGGMTAALEVEGAVPAGPGSGVPVRRHRQEPAAGCRRGCSSLRAVVAATWGAGSREPRRRWSAQREGPRPRAVGPRRLEPWATQICARGHRYPRGEARRSLRCEKFSLPHGDGALAVPRPPAPAT